jgi:hypothetical protein
MSRIHWLCFVLVMPGFLPLSAHGQNQTPPGMSAREFAVLASANAAFSVADFALTDAALKRGALEANPLFGRRPSLPRLWGEGVGILSAQTFMLYRLRRNHPTLARIVFIESAFLHGLCVARAARVIAKQK